MRWSSLVTVVGGFVVAVVGLIGLVTGHPWSALVVLLGLGVAARELRYLRRLRAGLIRER